MVKTSLINIDNKTTNKDSFLFCNTEPAISDMPIIGVKLNGCGINLEIDAVNTVAITNNIVFFFVIFMLNFFVKI